MSRSFTLTLLFCWAVCSASPAATTADNCHESSRNATTPTPADLPFAHGLFWKISKAGSKPSFLYGTIHLDIPRVTRLPPHVNLAFVQAAEFVAEVPLDNDAQKVYAEAIRLPGHAALDRLLGARDFQRLIELARDYAIPAEALARFKPWAATNLIARPPARSGIVLDEVLQQRAKDLQKPLSALESMPELVHRLDRMASADQLAILRDAICQHATIAAEAGSLLSAYAEEDLARIAAAASGPHADEALASRFQKLMLLDRNRLMVERLQQPLQRGNAFIALGALHLPGAQGVLRLLQQRDYEVTNEAL